MVSLESLNAFVCSAELGSFSAAARHLGKAQSAVSTAIANLEVDTGVELFDRSGRSPVLTKEGEALLQRARGLLLGSNEFMAKATSLAEGEEDQLCLAFEQGIPVPEMVAVVGEFADRFPHVSLEILEPGPNDVAVLLKEGRADIGLMTEQESYPQGFQFCGIGHIQLVPVCSATHPLARQLRVGYGELRQHRQIVLRSRSLIASRQLGEMLSTNVWFAESPFLIRYLLLSGQGWAELPLSVVQADIEQGELVRLRYEFQKSDMLQGVDVVWTERRKLGPAGRWLLDRFMASPQGAWRA